MLKLILYRTYLAENFTLGKLYIQEDDGEPQFFCWTLEPQVRKVKVWGRTAIPEGTYNIVWRYSPKFGKMMPHLQNVPDFSHVMLHPGNNYKHTQGCILVGELYNQYRGIIWHSRDKFAQLLALITRYLNKKQKVTITITHRTYEEYQRQEHGKDVQGNNQKN